jgi:hypothetical protein
MEKLKETILNSHYELKSILPNLMKALKKEESISENTITAKVEFIHESTCD